MLWVSLYFSIFRLNVCFPFSQLASLVTLLLHPPAHDPEVAQGLPSLRMFQSLKCLSEETRGKKKKDSQERGNRFIHVEILQRESGKPSERMCSLSSHCSWSSGTVKEAVHCGNNITWILILFHYCRNAVGSYVGTGLTVLFVALILALFHEVITYAVGVISVMSQ